MSSLDQFRKLSLGNSAGIHLWPNQYGADISYWLDRVVDMKLKWVTTLHTDAGFMRAAAVRGLQVVSRPFYRASREWGDDGSVVENMQAAGLTPLVQIYNEPELLATEWEGEVPGDENWAKETWANRWLAAASYIFNRGGWPGIQVLDPEWYRYLLGRIKAENPAIVERLWFSCHNYMSNHPPNYPYDALNPGKTIEDDWFAMLAPLKFDRVAREVLGHSLPTICTEGGYCVGDAADNRYPAITEELHRDYTLAMFDMFRTGVMPNGPSPEGLPDWWIAVTPWLLCSVRAGGDPAFEQNAWFGAWHPDRQLTIDAVKAMPAFTRNFQIQPEEVTTVPEFHFGFKEIADANPDAVGVATSEQIDVIPNLFSVQMAEKGIMIYIAGSPAKFFKQTLPKVLASPSSSI